MRSKRIKLKILNKIQYNGYFNIVEVPIVNRNFAMWRNAQEEEKFTKDIIWLNNKFGKKFIYKMKQCVDKDIQNTFLYQEYVKAIKTIISDN
jgi:hypothetical protein